MYKSFKRALFAVGILTLTLAVAGCAGDTSATTTTGMEDMGSDTTGMDDMESDFSFGAPADSADADRTVEIIASDDLTFDPAEMTVSPGEVITFRVINDGQIPHDFVLGD
jgi:plastocyanin